MNPKIVNIYSRILKYPIFSLKRTRKEGYDVTLKINNFSINITCFQTLNSVDADFLFVLIYIIGLQEKANAVKISTKKGFQTIGARMAIADISKMLNRHDYQYFEDCLKRLTSLTIFYSDKKFSESIRFVHHFEINKETQIMEIFFDFKVYELCQKGLKIDIDKMLSIKKESASALYRVLVSNSNIFREDTLIERCGIKSEKKFKAQQILKEAFSELIDKHILKSATVSKVNKVRVYSIEKFSNHP